MQIEVGKQVCSSAVNMWNHSFMTVFVPFNYQCSISTDIIWHPPSVFLIFTLRRNLNVMIILSSLSPPSCLPGSGSLSLTSSQASEVPPLTQLRWLPPSPQPSPAAGGWRWRQSSRTCSSPPCYWAGDPCSSCSSLRASTPTCAKDLVSQLHRVIVFNEGRVHFRTAERNLWLHQ